MTGIAIVGSALSDMSNPPVRVGSTLAHLTVALLRRRHCGEPASGGHEALDLGLGLKDLTPAIFARFEVDVVRPAAFAGILVLDIKWRRQSVRRATMPTLHA